MTVRVGVVKFASCDGCQLTLLDLEDHLLAVAQSFDIVEFPEASSTRSDGPYDILFVEGSVSASEHLEQIRSLRERTGILVTIGACATAGGIQALRNFSDHREFAEAVYARPEYVESLATSTPIADHVPVDAELRGCPIDGGQLLELLTAVSVGRRPHLPDESVCAECKRRGTACVMVRGMACLGPLTMSGCGALCPAYDRGCYGCFGPKEGANTESFTSWMQGQGWDELDVGRLFAGFTGWSPPFRDVLATIGGVPVHHRSSRAPRGGV